MWKKYGSLDEWLSSRNFLRCFSLLLALALWLYVVGDRNEEMVKEYEVRLEFLNPPAGLTLLPSSRSVYVTLNGERRAMSVIQSSVLVSDVDLKGLAAGKYRLPVRFSAPTRTTMTQLTPSTVEVELVRFADKEIPVVVKPPKNMSQGYVMDGASVNPDKVIVRGREEVVAAMKEVVVTPTVGQLEKGGTWSLTLHGPAEGMLKFTPPEVTASAAYFLGRPRKTVKVRAEGRGTLPSDLKLLKITTQPEEVSVEGNPEALAALDSLSTEKVNLSELKRSGTFKLRIASLPDGVSLLDSPFVTVNVSVESHKVQKTFVDLPIQVHGASGARWTVEPQTVKVQIEGVPEVMEKLDNKKLPFDVYIDVTNVIAKAIRLPVRIKFGISGLELVEVSPVTVKITVASDN